MAVAYTVLLEVVRSGLTGLGNPVHLFMMYSNFLNKLFLGGEGLLTTILVSSGKANHPKH